MNYSFLLFVFILLLNFHTANGMNEESGMFVTLSSKDYKMAIDVLSKSSQHNRLITETIQEHILPQLNNSASLLDVGSGPGIIARNLQSSFSDLTAIEPNSEMQQFYEGSGIHLYQQEFAAFQSDKKYDLVICSHVLYHMPIDTMSDFITKLLFYTKEGGFCFIALMADKGQNHNLHNQFNPSYVNSSMVRQALNDLEVNYSVFTATNQFEAATREDMLALCRFFVFEDCLNRGVLSQLTPAQKDALENEISSICDTLRHSDGIYRLNQEEDYFLIKMP